MCSTRNKTIKVSNLEQEQLLTKTLRMAYSMTAEELEDKIINDDFMDVIKYFPNEQFIDCVIIDPPYNKTQKFNDKIFNKIGRTDYFDFIKYWCILVKPYIKPNGSIYVCSDWQSSGIIQEVLEQFFIVRNRITWEREKGRGAKTNWKNSCEDIWFCTMSDTYTFNVEDVKLRRKVLAPYTDINDDPKDWIHTSKGNYRDTFPSNLWTDITVPFWSMAENTTHPTQKPEKLIAKLILASTNENDFVLDTFSGSGTTAVAAKKLNRRFCGIELDQYYAAVSIKRLEMAEINKKIQGYDGIFLDRNY